MFLQPLSFLRGRQPSKTSIWNRNPAILPDTAARSFSLLFGSDSQNTFYNEQTWLPHSNGEISENTLYHPPSHYHIWADEYFEVIGGSGTWHLWNEAKSIHLSEGDNFRVPKRTWHWFEGDPNPDKPLSIRVKYDGSNAAMEERFFRNVLGYMADCHRGGVQFSIFQVMIFFLYGDMAPGLRIVRFEWVNMVLNVMIVYIFGFIGLLMGYEVSYDEYYSPTPNMKRE